MKCGLCIRAHSRNVKIQCKKHGYVKNSAQKLRSILFSSLLNQVFTRANKRRIWPLSRQQMKIYVAKKIHL